MRASIRRLLVWVVVVSGGGWGLQRLLFSATGLTFVSGFVYAACARGLVRVAFCVWLF